MSYFSKFLKIFFKFYQKFNLFSKIFFKLKTLSKIIVKQVFKIYLIIYNIFSEGKTFSLKVF